MPSKTVAEVEKVLTETCKTFGSIASMVVRLQKDSSKPFAFVCFAENIEAENAYKGLVDADPFKCGEKLYVNWA
jgi:RNA recognition motif-containing protein